MNQSNDNELIGKLIQRLRKQQNITGSTLGRRVAMSQSKISKIENGQYSPLHYRDIERILNILNASDSLRQRIYRTINTGQQQKVRFQPYGIRYSKVMYERDYRCTTFKVFSPFIVPALLQTSTYRLALLRSYGSTEATLATLSLLHKRQELLWDTERSFHFIVHQSMLYSSLPGQKGIGPAQFDRIERFTDIPNIKLGIIPTQAGLINVECGPFAVLGEHVFLGSPDGDIAADDATSVALYTRLFTGLSQLAVYQDEARHLIKEAAVFVNP